MFAMAEKLILYRRKTVRLNKISELKFKCK